MNKNVHKLCIIVLIFIIFSNLVMAGEVQSDETSWIDLPLQRNVALDKVWTIEFSQVLTLKDINRINLVKDNEYIPIEIQLKNQENLVEITPKDKYDPNQRYTILIQLNNGLKYKMDFITKTQDYNLPNNTILTATIIEGNQPIEEYIESGTEEYFFIDIEDSGSLELEANRYDEENINLHFSILDYYNQEQELLRDGAKLTDWGGETSTDRAIVVDVEPGRYYIKLTTNYREDHQDIIGTSGNYRLSVNFNKTIIEEDSEPNDTIYDAIPIKLNTNKTGHIMYMRDNGIRDKSDYYKFKVLESGRVEISLERYDYSNINLYLCILDNMNKEKIVCADESTLIDNNLSSEKSIHVDLEPGEYFVKITTDYIYDYTSYEGDSGEYMLTLEFNKPDVSADLEINDSIHQAIPIKLNTSKEGHIMYTRDNGYRDEVDTYKFSVLKKGLVNIDLSRYDNRNINLYLTQLNMNKEKIIIGDYYDIYDMSNDNESEAKSNRTITYELEAGDYYIRIDTPFIEKHIYYDGYSGEYKLTLTFN